MELTLTDQNFSDTVNKATTPILVDFYADWCGPCKMLAPIVDEIAHEMEGKLVVGKLDVDHSPQTAGQFGVMSIPTLIVFKNGQPVKQLVGYQDKATLMKNIQQVVNS